MDEKEFLYYFITRIGMYTKDEKDCIVSFMHGYVTGKESSLLDDFSKMLEEKYKIIKRAIGWPHQVEIYSKKNSVTWEEGFKELILDFIEKTN